MNYKLIILDNLTILANNISFVETIFDKDDKRIVLHLNSKNTIIIYIKSEFKEKQKLLEKLLNEIHNFLKDPLYTEFDINHSTKFDYKFD